MNAKNALLHDLADGGLCRVDRYRYRVDPWKLAVSELQAARKIYVTEIGDGLYACLAPRSEHARLQEQLARHKLAYRSRPSSPDRDDGFARTEAVIADGFRAIGLPPTYPTGFL